MKISIIGLGGIAQKYYLPILSSDPATELQIFARTSETIQNTQAVWKISNTAIGLGDVIEWKPDAAFVLTNSVAHYEIVKQLIQNGIDVFVEKPVTLHTDQTMELAELARSNDRICMVGFNRRFAPLHQRAKEYWGNRKVELAEFTKLRTKPFHDDIRSHLYDDTIHLLDTMRYFCGEAKLAHRELRVEHQLITCVGVFDLRAGGIAIVNNSMRSGEWRENYLLTGDGLTMEIESFARLSIFQGDEQRSWKENYPAGNDVAVGRGFRGEIEHFLNCVKTREQPATDLSDSVKTQKLVEELAGD
jgi:virulence factor